MNRIAPSHNPAHALGMQPTTHPVIRLALLIFLILLVYDGALRKWLLPGYEQLIFVAKDMLLFTTLVVTGFASKMNSRAKFTTAAQFLLALYALWTILEVFNLNLPNLLVGAWGLKAHLLYASLIVLIPLAFQRLEDIYSALVKIYPWIVIPVVLLALLQVASPAYDVINQHVRGGIEGQAYFGDTSLVRVTGTFSYISGMSSFVLASVLLGVGLYLQGARSKIFLMGVAFALLAMPITGSRGVILVVTVSLALMLISAVFAGRILAKQAFTAVFVFSVFAIISLYSQTGAWQALQQRAEAARGDQYRVFTAFTNAFEHFDSAGIAGFGTGSANLGSPILANDVDAFSWLPAGMGFEEESGRIVIELGILGWLISLLMRLCFLLWAIELLRNGKTPNVRTTGIIALPIVAFGFYAGNGVFAVPLAAVYYWFCIALLAMAEHENRQIPKRNSLQSPSDIKPAWSRS